MRGSLFACLILTLAACAPETAFDPKAISSSPPSVLALNEIVISAAEPSMPRKPTETPAPPIPEELLSPPLRNETLHSPMPNGYLGGWYGDTGMDIAGRYLPVFALASGTLEYSERGHTLWTGKGDTPNSVRIRLDAPIPWKGHHVTHVYYTHLSELVTEQPEASATKKHVVAGERIATSGIGNGVAHLHVGLLLDNEVEQDSWDFILREGDIRQVMGGYKNGELLPAAKKK